MLPPRRPPKVASVNAGGGVPSAPRPRASSLNQRQVPQSSGPSGWLSGNIGGPTSRQLAASLGVRLDAMKVLRYVLPAASATLHW